MTATNPGAAATHQALDWLFARLGGTAVSDPPPAAEAPADPPPATAPPDPIPPIRCEADLQVAAQWLQRERHRLQEYTRIQLARIQHEHQAAVQQNYLHEQELILRSQEFTRKEELLLAHARELQQRSQEFSEREQDLAAQLQRCWRTSEELANLEKASDHVKQDVAQHQAVLDALRAETAALQRTRQTANAELQALTAATQDLRETRAREEATFRTRQRQLEQRLLAAEKAQQAAEQRQAELDDLECRVRQEFEGQEHDLLRRRSELVEWESRLRAATAELDPAGLAQRERELDALQATLAQVHSGLEEQWRELGRRTAELDRRDAQSRIGGRRPPEPARLPGTGDEARIRAPLHPPRG